MPEKARVIRRRISSVSNTAKITRTMEMVASTKLRRFQDRAIASRPYSQEIAGLVQRLSSMLGDDVADQPLFNPGKGSHSAPAVHRNRLFWVSNGEILYSMGITL